MHVSLTPKLEELVREKVESGLYNNASEVVREALRLMQEQEEIRRLKLERLRDELAKGEADIPTLVRAIYIGLDPRLTGAAGYSVLAHLEDLVSRGIVATDGDPVIGGNYRMAS